MPRVTIDMSRAGNLVNGPDILRRSIAEAAEESAIFVHGQLQRYPRQRAGVTYKRTRTLARSWFFEMTSTTRYPSARTYSSGNIAPYNRYVQDEIRQARFHRGTWKNTIQGVARESIEDVVDFYRTRVRRNFDL